MDEKQGVPFVVYEAEMVRQEKRNRRLVWIIVLTICCLVATNLAWLHAWLQYDYVGYQALSRDGGNASVIGKDGDIYNGVGDFEETDQEESEGR